MNTIRIKHNKRYFKVVHGFLIAQDLTTWLTSIRQLGFEVHFGSWGMRRAKPSTLWTGVVLVVYVSYLLVGGFYATQKGLQVVGDYKSSIEYTSEGISPR